MLTLTAFYCNVFRIVLNCLTIRKQYTSFNIELYLINFGISITALQLLNIRHNNSLSGPRRPSAIFKWSGERKNWQAPLSNVQYAGFILESSLQNWMQPNWYHNCQQSQQYFTSKLWSHLHTRICVRTENIPSQNYAYHSACSFDHVPFTKPTYPVRIRDPVLVGHCFVTDERGTRFLLSLVWCFVRGEGHVFPDCFIRRVLWQVTSITFLTLLNMTYSVIADSQMSLFFLIRFIS
jgi:hypothetical protein